MLGQEAIIVSLQVYFEGISTVNALIGITIISEHNLVLLTCQFLVPYNFGEHPCACMLVRVVFVILKDPKPRKR